MTNIGMIGRRSKSGELEFITAIADTQGTKTAEGIKGERFLKVYTVGKDRRILLLGTGKADIFNRTADELRAREGIATVEEAAGAILDITHVIYKDITRGKPESLARGGVQMNFLLGGPGSKGLEMVRVNSTGVGLGERKIYSNRRAWPIEVAPGSWNGSFDGSALVHVHNYIDGQNESGRPLVVNDMADAFVVSHDLSLRGAKDIGVNDRWCYGLVTPEKTVRLVHPGVQFRTTQEYLEHMSSFLNLDVSGVLGGLADEGIAQCAATDLASDLGRFNASFYFTLVSELDSSCNLKGEYTRLSEVALMRSEFRPRFDAIGQRRLESLARVRDGIQALLSGDARTMRNYVEAAKQREEVVAKELLDKYLPKSD